jgi:hypothetical protein
MPAWTFEREARTPQSESYAIEQAGAPVGRVDIHFTSSMVYATLCVPDTYDDATVEDLIGEIDERLVLTAEPYRDDFIVTVWRGALAGVYSEDDDDEEEDDGEDEDSLGPDAAENGRTPP